MSFHDVAFLLSRASFSTTFDKSYCRGDSLANTTCDKTVAGGKQGYLPCMILLLHKASFLSVEFN